MTGRVYVLLLCVLLMLPLFWTLLLLQCRGLQRSARIRALVACNCLSQLPQALLYRYRSSIILLREWS